MFIFFYIYYRILFAKAICFEVRGSSVISQNKTKSWSFPFIKGKYKILHYYITSLPKKEVLLEMSSLQTQSEFLKWGAYISRLYVGLWVGKKLIAEENKFFSLSFWIKVLPEEMYRTSDINSMLYPLWFQNGLIIYWKHNLSAYFERESPSNSKTEIDLWTFLHIIE